MSYLVGGKVNSVYVELMSMTELDQSALTHTEVREAMYDSAGDGLVLCF